MKLCSNPAHRRQQDVTNAPPLAWASVGYIDEDVVRGGMVKR